ncbi:ras-related protein Rab-6.2 [Mycetomoellerius zeteki]|uniref:ras-related protein Rab-6.2 n=1 Tax=Mycetomoellerius zeteki TaxID=64791 RepID=UPI00084E78B8|nr:PREDICTED: ras-related protein Rab-6.2 [Trachymyrmex zeteki]
MATVKVTEQKVILCGEYGVGKTSIFRRFANNTFVASNDRKSTLGLDNIDKEYVVEDRRIRLQLWDTGALDNSTSFHLLSQHLLDIVTYAENAKIFLCGNKSDLESVAPQVTDAEMEQFCEQCHNLISGIYKTSCKTGEGVNEMFEDIAQHLVEANRSRMELHEMDKDRFKISYVDEATDPSCLC